MQAAARRPRSHLALAVTPPRRAVVRARAVGAVLISPALQRGVGETRNSSGVL